MKKSTDGGKTWSSAICIEPGSSAYSTACELSDGSIGVLFEKNAYQEIAFAKFSNDEFRPIVSVLDANQATIDIEFTVIPRYIRPGRNQEVESQIKSAPTVPEVDMNGFNVTERKEVGPAGGTTSGDALYTVEELEKILGPISPGLHISDEVRFSARISNQLPYPIVNLRMVDRLSEKISEYDSMNAGDKECALDIRQKVTSDDVSAGLARFTFELTGEIRNANGPENSIFTKVVTFEMPIN
jgi:sialidase-1